MLNTGKDKRELGIVDVNMVILLATSKIYGN